MRRFRSTQRLNSPGKTATKDEAQNAINNHGTASRTENWIIEETPSELDKSTAVIANKAAKHIGTTTIEKSAQPLTALCLIMDISFGCP
tara:strand:+ start:133 stop:399 length:267 start_codon:yes stop_codon:yes gene_type:complete